MIASDLKDNIVAKDWMMDSFLLPAVRKPIGI